MIRREKEKVEGGSVWGNLKQWREPRRQNRGRRCWRKARKQPELGSWNGSHPVKKSHPVQNVKLRPNVKTVLITVGHKSQRSFVGKYHFCTVPLWEQYFDTQQSISVKVLLVPSETELHSYTCLSVKAFNCLPVSAFRLDLRFEVCVLEIMKCSSPLVTFLTIRQGSPPRRKTFPVQTF